MNYQTIEQDPRSGDYDIYEHGVYEESSVLAGRARRSFLDSYSTLEAAQQAWPDAAFVNHSTRVDGYNSGDLMPIEPPSWFDPMDAGEAWSEYDY